MEKQRFKRNIFTMAILDHCLYGTNTMRPVDMRNICEKNIEMNNNNNEVSIKDCALCLTQTTRTSSYSLHKSIEVEHAGYELGKLSYAVMSFPDEVQLCTSSIPGSLYGVSAKRPLPSGTVIGPYEGRQSFDQRTTNQDNHEYLWEIYSAGKFSHFIDGSDENCSSWMRFIRCARNRKEQNMVAYQLGENIYYQVFSDIRVGEELLVWYSDHYNKHLEIPLSLKGRNEGKETNEEEYPSSTHTLEDHRDEILPPSPSSRQQLTTTESSYSDWRSMPCPAMKRHGEKSSLENSSCSVQKISGTGRNEEGKRLLLEKKEKFGRETEVKKYFTIGNEKSSSHAGDAATTFTENTGRHSTFNYISLPFECKQCKKVFTQRIQLQMHVCPQQQPYKPFQCGYCCESFDLPSELRNHVVIHSSERSFKCGFCGRSFAGATTLNNHVRTHTGERPFVCKACGKTFAIATQLARHSRVQGECHSQLTVNQEQ